jgi:hypothetical protein
MRTEAINDSYLESQQQDYHIIARPLVSRLSPGRALLVASHCCSDRYAGQPRQGRHRFEALEAQLADSSRHRFEGELPWSYTS